MSVCLACSEEVAARRATRFGRKVFTSKSVVMQVEPVFVLFFSLFFN